MDHTQLLWKIFTNSFLKWKNVHKLFFKWGAGMCHSTCVDVRGHIFRNGFFVCTLLPKQDLPYCFWWQAVYSRLADPWPSWLLCFCFPSYSKSVWIADAHWPISLFTWVKLGLPGFCGEQFYLLNHLSTPNSLKLSCIQDGSLLLHLFMVSFNYWKYGEAW